MGKADHVLADGMESMSSAPFMMPKANQVFLRYAGIYKITIG
jgi:acetyl-CoA acetyltransferase